MNISPGPGLHDFEYNPDHLDVWNKFLEALWFDKETPEENKDNNKLKIL